LLAQLFEVGVAGREGGARKGGDEGNAQRAR
jgi:hypothetical protein